MPKSYGVGVRLHLRGPASRSSVEVSQDLANRRTAKVCLDDVFVGIQLTKRIGILPRSVGLSQHYRLR